jgi:hypothetical protein
MAEDFISGSGGVAVQRSAFVVPALRKEREGQGTHFVGDISEIKNMGDPPRWDGLFNKTSVAVLGAFSSTNVLLQYATKLKQTLWSQGTLGNDGEGSWRYIEQKLGLPSNALM